MRLNLSSTLQSNKSMRSKTKKLEALFDDGWEGAPPSIRVACTIAHMSFQIGSTRRILSSWRCWADMKGTTMLETALFCRTRCRPCLALH